MTENENVSQAQRDNQAQSDLTSKVGVKLTRPEKSTTSPWATLRRFLRIG